MTSKTTNKFSPEVRARAVRMVTEHEAEHPSRWAAVSSIAAKIGCSAHTLHEWVKKAEVDSGKRAGLPSDVAEKMKALERENRELRQANEILRKASAYFAQAELDRRTGSHDFSFVDERIATVHGVEPICKVAADRPVDLPRPRRPASAQPDDGRLSARVKRESILLMKVEIQKGFR